VLVVGMAQGMQHQQHQRQLLQALVGVEGVESQVVEVVATVAQVLSSSDGVNQLILSLLLPLHPLRLNSSKNHARCTKRGGSTSSMQRLKLKV
jgi:hypothetical protein